MEASMKPYLSFVVPVKNESATLRELYERIETHALALGHAFEVIFVDDGSDDESWATMRSLAMTHPDEVRAIRFRTNLGKAAALAAGFRAAGGEIVFTLDADLQDDPREIPRFLGKLSEGYDIVSGWKKTRHDPWHKVLPSRVFNAMLSTVSRTRLHDHNCGFKCYRGCVVKELVIYGEMHRMLPALGTIRGFRSAEIEVQHHPRRFGRSKYGFERFLRGFLDMLTVGFLRRYRERPLHAMGGMAAATGLLGIAAIVAGLALLVQPARALPLVVIGASMLASAVVILAVGFVAELLVHLMAPARQPLPIEEELREVSPPAQERHDRRPPSVSGIPPARLPQDSEEFDLVANDSVR
jgi:dolichol-phosphate mannosyltransferase